MKTKKGRKTWITANLQPIVKNRKVYLQVEFYAREGQGDGTKFGGKKLFELKNVPSNCKVVDLLANIPFRYYRAITGEHHEFVNLSLPKAGSFLTKVEAKFDEVGRHDYIALRVTGVIRVSAVCQ